MAINLYEHQVKALGQMKNGCILCGKVGSGKSRTAIAYYFTQCGGRAVGGYSPMKNPIPLYIITTARKRDTKEWDEDLAPFLLSSTKNGQVQVVVDSWNNITKYKEIKDSFFIFDEQRVVGSGVWVKSFLSISKKNKWILLSATPGDTWSDYVPVFIANGYFKSRHQFETEHVIFSRFTNFPKIDRYIGISKLERLRREILVDMQFENRKPIDRNYVDIFVDYDSLLYKSVMKTRARPFSERYEPIESVSELCYTLRKIVNSDDSRVDKLCQIIDIHPKLIVFYNFDYELEIIKSIDIPEGIEMAEWNGHKHEPIPDADRWIYLVQYAAGAEGWNCIQTNTIVFYSQNYSYKVMIQSAGRIDRLNTPFEELWYYHFKSKAPIDLAIDRAIKSKKIFNESAYFKR